jgi:protein SDA1
MPGSINTVADPTVTAEFPNQLIELITLHHAELETELRDKVVGSLVLLRNKDVIDSSTLLNTLFPILVTTPSKRFVLRANLCFPKLSIFAVSVPYSLLRSSLISAPPM